MKNVDNDGDGDDEDGRWKRLKKETRKYENKNVCAHPHPHSRDRIVTVSHGIGVWWMYVRIYTFMKYDKNEYTVKMKSFENERLSHNVSVMGSQRRKKNQQEDEIESNSHPANLFW